MSALPFLLGAVAYLLLGLGLLRIFRVYLDWRDARALQRFNAAMMLANAQAFAELFPAEDVQ